jgi:hypothetical protein
MDLREDRRSRFGLIADIWGVCPHCDAQFDYQMGGRARLDSYDADPFGVGKKHGGQSLSIDEWRLIAGRTGDVAECDKCLAQWDVPGNGQLTLGRTPIDPFGVGAAMRGRSLPRLAWSKIAANIAADQGNLHCQNCHAEFDYHRDAKTIALLKTGSVLPPWAAPFVGQTVPLPAFAFAAAGKTSNHAGLLCPGCSTEFDDAPGGLRLVRAASPELISHIGETYLINDWHRIGLGLPSGADAGALRTERQRLLTQKQNDQMRWQGVQRGQRVALEREFNELLRQSVIGGHIPIERVSHHAPQNSPQSGVHIAVRGGSRRVQLRASENVLWESPAQLCSVRIERGVPLWSRHSWGSFLVTSERVLFSVPGDTYQLWQKPLRSVASVEMQYVQGAPVVLLTFSDPDPAVGFLLNEVKWDVVVDGETHSLTFAPHEVASLMMQQIH